MDLWEDRRVASGKQKKHMYVSFWQSQSFDLLEWRDHILQRRSSQSNTYYARVCSDPSGSKNQCNNFDIHPNLQPAPCNLIQPRARRPVLFCFSLELPDRTAPLDIMLEQEEPYLPVLNSLIDLYYYAGQLKSLP